MNAISIVLSSSILRSKFENNLIASKTINQKNSVPNQIKRDETRELNGN